MVLYNKPKTKGIQQIGKLVNMLLKEQIINLATDTFLIQTF